MFPLYRVRLIFFFYVSLWLLVAVLFLDWCCLVCVEHFCLMCFGHMLQKLRFPVPIKTKIFKKISRTFPFYIVVSMKNLKIVLVPR